MGTCRRSSPVYLITRRLIAVLVLYPVVIIITDTSFNILSLPFLPFIFFFLIPLHYYLTSKSHVVYLILVAHEIFASVYQTQRLTGYTPGWFVLVLCGYAVSSSRLRGTPRRENARLAFIDLIGHDGSG
jgi:hypothetical protein